MVVGFPADANKIVTFVPFQGLRLVASLSGDAKVIVQNLGGEVMAEAELQHEDGAVDLLKRIATSLSLPVSAVQVATSTGVRLRDVGISAPLLELLR